MATEGGGSVAPSDDDSMETTETMMETIPPSGDAQDSQVMIIVSPWQQDINLTTKHGSSLWNEGTKPVDEKFTGQGKDVPRFIAMIKNHVAKCYLTDIIMINGKNLLSDYGTTSLEEIKRVRDRRNSVHPTTLREAQPKIKAQILFHFIYGSLGSLPLRKISTRLEEIGQDGPTLLKVVLVDTFVATQAHTFKIKEQLYDLQMKAFKWNVQAMNQSVREIMVDLQAAGHSFGTDEIMIVLFRAYVGSTNDEFKNAVMYWKNEWSNGSLVSAEELMIKADGKYDELKKAGTWGKSSDKDEQIVALTAKLETLQKEVSKAKGSSTSAPVKSEGKFAWKYDRSLSASATYVRDGKTFKWCTGPGHNKKAMWVSGHEPGKCSADYKGGKAKGGSKAPPSASTTRVDRSALTTLLQNASPGLSASELDSKVQAFLSVLES